MDEPATNGALTNGSDRGLAGTAHGEAALLLVECLMHHLVDNKIISREDFIDVVEGAAEVECGGAFVQHSLPSAFSRSLLYPLADAFRKELGR